jgi:hypothetical protein
MGGQIGVQLPQHGRQGFEGVPNTRRNRDQDDIVSKNVGKVIQIGFAKNRLQVFERF